jgi:hypothetical protein
MAIELPGPVADFLGFIGINWPNVNEDKVREFGQHVAQFGQSLQQTQQDASTTVQSLGQAYQGAGYEQLLATWGAKSDSHMSELITGCQLVSTAMDAGADVIVGMKVEAIGQLVVMAAEFLAAQAAAIETLGASEAVAALIEEEGQQLVKFLEQELLQYVEGQIIDAAVGPLIDKVAQAVSGLVYQGVADALGVPAGGAGGAGGAVTMSPSAVLGYVQQLDGHAQTVAGHAEQFTSAAGGMSFE